jgi:hypothetical protein
LFELCSLAFFIADCARVCQSNNFFLYHVGLCLFRTSLIYHRRPSFPIHHDRATYCPGSDGSPLDAFATCLGDLYSVSWMEDVEARDPRAESLEGQILRVKRETSMVRPFLFFLHFLRVNSVGFHGATVCM